MTFKITSTTIGTAVVSGGTITFSYPDNTSAGNFAAYGHKLNVDKHQKLYRQPEMFTVSFGASTITVTYNGSTTIPVGSVVKLQANIEGPDDGVLDIELPPIHSATLDNIVKIDLGSPDAAVANGYCASQNLTSAGVFSTSVTAAAAIAAASLGGIADVPRNVVAAWTTNAVLTITGKDEYGNTVVEKSAGGSASFTGKKAFKQITGISSDTDITALTVGTGTVLGLPFFLSEAGQVIAEYESGARLARKNNKYYTSLLVPEATVDAGTTQMITTPVAGTIKKLTAIVDNTVTTGGAFTMEVNDVAVAGLACTVTDGAVAGNVFTGTPTAGSATANVAVGDKLEILIAAAFNASANVQLILEIEASPAQQLQGTLVAGVTAKATATTGDIRGTYVPLTTPDGATAETLVVYSPSPKYRGTTQYAG